MMLTANEHFLDTLRVKTFDTIVLLGVPFLERLLASGQTLSARAFLFWSGFLHAVGGYARYKRTSVTLVVKYLCCTKKTQNLSCKNVHSQALTLNT